MKQKALKLILSGAATLALAVSLTATTFAYVLIGNNVTVEEFDFNVEVQKGLLVSLDGENFSQDITSDQLKVAIAGSIDAFDNNTIKGTTIRQTAGNPLIENKAVVFEKEKIDYIKTTDTYERSYVEAVNNKDYISFPLYFQVEGAPTATNYKLTFGENTYIKGNKDSVELVNSFDTWLRQDSGKYKKQSYLAEDVIYQNVANAMRLGIYNENMTNQLSVYEVTDSDDLGSAAITGRTDLKHDPYSSVMINYYNQVFPRYPFRTNNEVEIGENGEKVFEVYGAVDGSAFNTVDHFYTTNGNGEVLGETVGEFTKDALNKFEVMQITVYIWLEGWDADYIVGTSMTGSEIKCCLEFNLTEAN